MKSRNTHESITDRSVFKRRLVLYLSGKWKTQYAEMFDQDDYLYCAPGLADNAPELNWKELAHHPKSSDLLSKKYTDLALSRVKGLDQNESNAILNSHFDYGVIPIAAQLEEIDRLISELNPQSLVVVSSKSRMRHIPAIGIVTSESNRGSPHLLGSLTASAIVSSNIELHTDHIVAPGDFLSNPVLRYICLRIATIALVLVAAKRIILSPLQTSRRLGNDYTAIVCLRSVGQAGHTARIFDGVDKVAALMIPQFTGKCRMSDIAQIIGSRTPLFRPSSIDVLYALAKSIFRLTPVKRDHSHIRQQLKIGRFSVPASPQDLAREMHLFPHLLFHKILIERSLQRFNGNIRKLVGFEIKGPFSSIEAMAGRACGVRTVVVQTVLTQPRALPVFPWPDHFYADGIVTAETIKDTGYISPGRVEFVGTPHSVTPLKSDTAIRSVVFMSQPYEVPQTLSVLQSLCEVARDLGLQIRIRLHPRDDQKNYLSILNSDQDVLDICEAQNLTESISKADLCVTRTSSTAKEASAAGKPVMICLWSKFDRSIIADYILRDSVGQRYVATNAAEMRKILVDTEQLIAANVELHARMFGDKDLNALRAAIVG